MQQTRGWGDRMEGWAIWLDRRPAVVAVLLAALYAVLVLGQLRTILWYDELHTYYIAQAPSLARMFDEMRHVDLNPPLIYLLVRASHSLFGVSIVATRLPSTIAFFLGSAAAGVFLARRIGALWAAAAVALFWFSPFFRYATEARPYGILLAFFSLTLLSWDSATRETPGQSSRAWALAGIVAGNTGMMLSHVLAPLSILPFLVAELVRSARRRRLDGAVWAALLLPLAVGIVDLPLLRQVGMTIYPAIYRASPAKIGAFYGGAFTHVLPALIPALALAFLVAWWRRGPSVPWHFLDAREAPLLATALLPPVLLNLMMMRSGGPFWDRYSITTALIFYVLIVLFVAHECRLNRLAGLAALLVLLAYNLLPAVNLIEAQARWRAARHIAIDGVRPELPFVVNAATTFLALDHHESAAFLDRVYYLVDEPSALRYAHTNLFEGIAGLKPYFPLRAHIESYADFAARHPRFLVFGESDQPDQWLLRKLAAEGAHIEKIGEFDTPYEDSRLQEVTLPAP
jgi:hypothetical protein